MVMTSCGIFLATGVFDAFKGNKIQPTALLLSLSYLLLSTLSFLVLQNIHRQEIHGD